MVAFSPGGRWAVTEGTQSTLGVWGAAPVDPARRIPTPGGDTASLAVSPEGLLVAVGRRDGQIVMLSPDTGREAFRIEAHLDAVFALAFSPDGASLASGSADCSVCLWSSRTGAPLRRFLGHDRGVRALAFAPDGRRLASGGADAVALVWDTTPGRPAPPPRPLDPVAFQEHWAALASDAGEASLRATWALVDAGDAVVPGLGERIAPVPGDAERAARLRRLVADLDDDRYEVRDGSTRALREEGPAAEPYVREALDAGASPELRLRAESVLAHYAQMDNAPTPDALRRSRTIRILECIGTPAARAALERVAAQAVSPRERVEARASL
jgi:hypothetical protein